MRATDRRITPRCPRTTASRSNSRGRRLRRRRTAGGATRSSSTDTARSPSGATASCGWCPAGRRILPVPEVATALAKLPEGDFVLDGELVVPGADGRQDFSAVGRALGDGGKGLVFVAFDLLWRKRDLRAEPFTDRRAQLEALLAPFAREGARAVPRARGRGRRPAAEGLRTVAGRTDREARDVRLHRHALRRMAQAQVPAARRVHRRRLHARGGPRRPARRIAPGRPGRARPARLSRTGRQRIRRARGTGAARAARAACSPAPRARVAAGARRRPRRAGGRRGSELSRSHRGRTVAAGVVCRRTRGGRPGAAPEVAQERRAPRRHERRPRRRGAGRDQGRGRGVVRAPGRRGAPRRGRPSIEPRARTRRRHRRDVLPAPPLAGTQARRARRCARREGRAGPGRVRAVRRDRDPRARFPCRSTGARAIAWCSTSIRARASAGRCCATRRSISSACCASWACARMRASPAGRACT